LVERSSNETSRNAQPDTEGIEAFTQWPLASRIRMCHNAERNTEGIKAIL
jgi:hypothetical protein